MGWFIFSGSAPKQAHHMHVYSELSTIVFKVWIELQPKSALLLLQIHALIHAYDTNTVQEKYWG